MAAEPNKRKPNESANGGGKKHDRWKHIRSTFRAVGCWFSASIKNPDNIPGYLTAIFTLFLAAFAFYAWDEATRGTKAMEGQLRAMQADQRPYIYLTNNFASPIFRSSTEHIGTGQIGWTWQVTNYGRGAAHHFRFSNAMKVGDGEYRLSYTTVELSELNKDEADIPPGKNLFGTVVSFPGYTHEQFSNLMKVDGGLTFLLKFEYFDVYGILIL